MDRTQTRLLYLYEFKMGHSPALAAQRINEAFGEGTTTDHTVREWFKKFRDGEESLEDKPHPGRPSEINDADLIAAVEKDPHQSLAQLGAQFGVARNTILEHLKKIGKVYESGEWVSPH